MPITSGILTPLSPRQRYSIMAVSDELDRGDVRESRESPFATLQKRVAGLKVQDDNIPPDVEEDEPEVVERIESLCINCEENV